MIERHIIKINGIVQGVGFRPFVHNLAEKHNISGYVRNDSHGVEIDAQGESESLSSFISQLRTNPPSMARIYNFQIKKEFPHIIDQFRIVESESDSINTTSISPDIAICPECLKELFDPGDRRYRYPFINCTNCGPRYSIIFNVPYDRPNTSMNVFPMCSDCEREYHNQSNRRYHAQPNACPVCGPQVQLMDKDGKLLNVDPIKYTVDLLMQGAIVAVKGIGGFQLFCDADNNAAVQLLRQRKRREAKPLAVMSADLTKVQTYAHYSSEEAQLLISPRMPIVLLPKNQQSPLAEQVAPVHTCYGVMLAYTPLHHLILDSALRAVVATSGNMSEEPIAISNNEAFKRLNLVADYFLIHNRDILVRNDDSVVRVINHKPVMIRRSRGYVPEPVLLPKRLPPVLGLGGELKNTLCLIRENTAYFSQHIGDMENVQAIEFFHETEEHLLKLFDVHPEIVAHDLHPDYYTTRYAHELKAAEKTPVQHHHAHMVSCLAENNHTEPAIGIILDGTGYGTDGNVWGGEALYGDWTDFKRLAHLEYVPMPGGEKAVREPWRMGISYLYHTFKSKFYDLSLPVLRYKNVETIDFIVRMMDQGINCPLTSSCGRLFDGVSAILGIQMENRYEGQAAIEMEQLINIQQPDEFYPVQLTWDALPVAIPVTPIIEGVVGDFLCKIPAPFIIAKFHRTVARLFFSIADTLGHQFGVSTVALSGGCFQNVYLSTYLQTLCEEAGIKVLTHSQVPPNDGGISLGQAVVAGMRKKGRRENLTTETRRGKESVNSYQ